MISLPLGYFTKESRGDAVTRAQHDEQRGVRGPAVGNERRGAFRAVCWRKAGQSGGEQPLQQATAGGGHGVYLLCLCVIAGDVGGLQSNTYEYHRARKSYYQVKHSIAGLCSRQ